MCLQDIGRPWAWLYLQYRQQRDQQHPLVLESGRRLSQRRASLHVRLCQSIYASAGREQARAQGPEVPVAALVKVGALVVFLDGRGLFSGRVSPTPLVVRLSSLSRSAGR